MGERCQGRYFQFLLTVARLLVVSFVTTFLIKKASSQDIFNRLNKSDNAFYALQEQEAILPNCLPRKEFKQLKASLLRLSSALGNFSGIPCVM